MKIEFISRDNLTEPKGLVCVIDVFRAFSVTAYAFAQGAEKIILVKTPEEAFELKKQNPSTLLMGEERGIKIEGFDFGNCPIELSQTDLTGKTLIQRTSNGTQGVVNNKHAKHLIVASFPNAKATIDYIKNKNSENVTFVITDRYKSPDDGILGLYLANSLRQDPIIDIQSYINLLQTYRKNIKTDNETIEACLALDKFDFTMEVTIENGLAVLRKK